MSFLISRRITIFVAFLKNKVDAFHSLDKSGLQIDGEKDGAIKYNYEYLMQWGVR